MKYRVIRKKIKKHHIIDMWFRADDDWNKALTGIAKKYPEGTDPNDYDPIDKARFGIGCNMMRYDWLQILKEGEKIGFGYRIMNKYANEKL